MKSFNKQIPRDRTVDQSLPGSEERVEWRVTPNEYGISFENNKNVLKLDSGDDYTAL